MMACRTALVARLESTEHAQMMMSTTTASCQLLHQMFGCDLDEIYDYWNKVKENVSSLEEALKRSIVSDLHA